MGKSTTRRCRQVELFGEPTCQHREHAVAEARLMVRAVSHDRGNGIPQVYQLPGLCPPTLSVLVHVRVFLPIQPVLKHGPRSLTCASQRAKNMLGKITTIIHHFPLLSIFNSQIKNLSFLFSSFLFTFLLPSFPFQLPN